MKFASPSFLACLQYAHEESLISEMLEKEPNKLENIRKVLCETSTIVCTSIFQKKERFIVRNEKFCVKFATMNKNV